MASIDKLKGLDVRAGKPAHHIQDNSERTLRERSRQTRDFLQELANMQDQRKYSFAGDTIDGIYTTVDHSGYVTEGQKRAINNIRRGVGDEEI